MADGVAVTPGVGATIATDDIGGQQYQRVKMVLGADGVNGGDVASGNPMPVTGSVTVDMGANNDVRITDGTDVADVVAVDGSNGLVVVCPSHVSTGNSTTTPLAGGATFTGAWEEVTNYGIITTSVYASHASATNGFIAQFSTDGTITGCSDEYSIGAGLCKFYSFPIMGRFFRMVYTNGGTLQTAFRLQTLMKTSYSKPSSHRVGDSVSLEDDAELSKSIIAGETTAGGGGFVNVKVNPSGALQVAGTIDVVTSLGSITSSVVPGTAATNLGKAEDAAHTTGDVGVLALAVRQDVPNTTPTSANGDYAALTTDSKGNLRVNSPLGNPGSVDSFGHLIVGGRNNQIDVQFYKDTPSNLLTVTTTNSGTATQSLGGALFSTTANTSGTAKGVTTSSAAYSAGGEMYALFTAAWANAGVTASFQRIGLYDDNNGFFIGYEGTSFGITYRTAGSDTSVAKASWNVDTLTGAAGSLFTRDGVPEAINLTYANVFRIRFGWLGEAPVIYEVLSPDGVWVPFHIIKQPNTSASPSIQNPDLPMTVHVSKTAAGATNLTLQTYCWGAGCTLSRLKMNSTLSNSSLTETTRSVQAAEISSALGTFMNIRCDSSGNQNVALAAGTNNIGDVDVLTLPGVAGTAAHDAAISGNPVRVGMRAASSLFTAVGDGDAVDMLSTITGKQVIMPYCLPACAWRYVGPTAGLTSTTPVSLVAAGGAGVKHYVTTISFTNSHQTIGTNVVIRNSTTTTTELYRGWCQFAGGGVAMKFDPPLASIANQGIEVLEETATGTAGVVVTITGYTSAE